MITCDKCGGPRESGQLGLALHTCRVGTDGPPGLPAAQEGAKYPCPKCDQHGISTVGGDAEEVWALCMTPGCPVYGYLPFQAPQAAAEGGVAPNLSPSSSVLEERDRYRAALEKIAEKPKRRADAAAWHRVLLARTALGETP